MLINTYAKVRATYTLPVWFVRTYRGTEEAWSNQRESIRPLDLVELRVCVYVSDVSTRTDNCNVSVGLWTNSTRSLGLLVLAHSQQSSHVCECAQAFVRCYSPVGVWLLGENNSRVCRMRTHAPQVKQQLKRSVCSFVCSFMFVEEKNRKGTTTGTTTTHIITVAVRECLANATTLHTILWGTEMCASLGSACWLVRANRHTVLAFFWLIYNYYCRWTCDALRCVFCFCLI